MTRKRILVALAAFVMMGAACLAVQAQEGGRSGRGPGRGMGMSRGSLIGLLGMEAVQKEMKLSEEQTTKVKELVEKLRTEMREQSAALREIEDRAERQEKMSALGNEFDGKVREQLRGMLEREQVMRLYQIRMQVRPALDSLANQYVARRLELTDEQKSKLEEIGKEMAAKQSELFAAMREAGEDGRSEAMQKMRDLRTGTEEKALAVLTDEQKKSFEEMKGEPFEMPRRGGRGQGQ